MDRPRGGRRGSTPFHGLETLGALNVVSNGGFGPGEFVGDGAVEFDEASMEDGGVVSGRFSGLLLQFACVAS